MGNPAGLCQTCRWYGAERADTGSCRLNAPVIFGTSGAPQQTNQLVWPEVRIDDWCSEFSDQGTSWTPPSGGPGSVAGVSSFNTRTGAVTLTTADVTGAGGAPIASPTFTGTPTLPTGTVGVTQTAGNNSTALATTAFVATNFLADTGGTVTGTLTVSGQGIIKGTTTNDSAAAGFVGEYISSVVVAPGTTLTSSTSANIATVSLTAGDWDVSGELWVQIGTGAATTIAASISSTSGGLGAVGASSRAVIAATFFASTTQVVPLPPIRMSLSTTTTMYLVANVTFPSGTTTAYGRIGARRMR